ncbi:hypothetical protein DXG01_007213 [Tephrocybe rancida]|nr:hypothetical protein DXG01_007213 [Tephrocybe rancida]
MFASFALTLLLAASACAKPFTTRVCGTVPSDAEVDAMEKHFTANKVVPFSAKHNAAAVTYVDVSYRFVFDKPDRSLPIADLLAHYRQGPYFGRSAQILDQLAVINKAYIPLGVSFVLANITRTISADWFNNAGPDTTQQTAMKTSLRRGSAGDLNVYSVGFTSGSGAGLLGYATFPSSYSSAPSDDGVVILYSSLPGGTAAPYNLSHVSVSFLETFKHLTIVARQTLTHEAGHWFGLYHTFQGGCSGSGDSVSDTAPEASAAFGCPTGSDTCSGGGVDPIHNFMDYTDDSCMTQFTTGQAARAKSQVATYRGLAL